jgi:hypothetical protein
MMGMISVDHDRHKNLRSIFSERILPPKSEIPHPKFTPVWALLYSGFLFSF